MREIKFRAWDKEEKKTIVIKSLKTDDIGNLYYINRELVNPTNIVMMQYTGLKDRIGTEIYESDVLHWKDLSELSDGTLECNVRVFWDDEHLRWSIETLEKFRNIEKLYDYSDIREIEVIGNIYENPELLDNNNG